MENRTNQMYANIGKLITSSLDIHQVVDGVMSEIKLFFDPEHWSLLRLDHASGELYFLYMQGNGIERLKHFRLHPGEGIAGTVAKTGKSVFVPDAGNDPRFSDRVDKLINFRTHSIIAVPLIHREITYGVIEIVNCEKKEQFSESDHLIMKTIADFTAISLANSSLYHQVIEQNCHDILTGLYNRRMLNDFISQRSHTGIPARRYSDSGEEVIVVYMDVNNFKSINDIYGHREGDTALVSISKKLKNIFRNEDMLFRIGGDEFLAIIKVNGQEDTAHIIERINDDFNMIFYTSPDGALQLSVSHGIVRGSVKDMESLINNADKLMYMKK